MNLKTWAICLSTACISLSAHAQSIIKKGSYGGVVTQEWGQGITKMNDGSLVVVGMGGSIGFGLENLFVYKTDTNCNVLWHKEFGTDTANDQAKCVIATTDGNILVGGNTESYGTGAVNMYVIKLTPSGDTLWTRTYEPGQIAYAMCNNYSGGYTILGSAKSPSLTDDDNFLVKVDASGNVLWTKQWGTHNHEYPTSILQAADSGYYIAGSSKETPMMGDYFDGYLAKVDKNGDLEWTKYYDGPEEGEYSGDVFRSIKYTADGNIIAAGVRGINALSSFSGKAWLAKLNLNGDTLWTKAWGHVNDTPHQANAVNVSDSGNYFVTGTVYRDTASYMFTSSYNSSGTHLWTLESLVFTGIPSNHAAGLGAVGMGNKVAVTGYYTSVDSTYQSYHAIIGYRNSSNISSPQSGTSQVMVYPNPAGNYIQLSHNIPDATVSVYNINGQQINCSIHNNTISIGHLPTGTYTITLTNSHTKVSTSFIKN